MGRVYIDQDLCTGVVNLFMPSVYVHKSDLTRPRICLGCGADLSHRRIDVDVCDRKCYRQAHAKELRAANARSAAKRYRINRDNLIAYLQDHSCVDCGETDIVVLEFDHRDGVEKREKIANVLGSWNWETILTEIAKCDVRCANCHRRRTSRQFGWFKEGVMPYDTEPSLH